jgi:hypothetical protein
MSPTQRELTVAPSAVEAMSKAQVTPEERLAISNLLNDLCGNPMLGYEIRFLHPTTYRIDAGRFHIHYRFDDQYLKIGFIGVY